MFSRKGLNLPAWAVGGVAGGLIFIVTMAVEGRVRMTSAESAIVKVEAQLHELAKDQTMEERSMRDELRGIDRRIVAICIKTGADCR